MDKGLGREPDAFTWLKRGYKVLQYIELILLMLHGGGRHIEELAELSLRD
ncbi:MAG: hypothetical protein N2511_08205 [Thermodesulfovibrionales bacterium]|nr:hypothetical protein [Thermodesulfovibrionales bacterium]